MHQSNANRYTWANIRGHIVEARFVALVNDPRLDRPPELLYVEQAEPLLDVRGIDLFVVCEYASRPGKIRSIPIQIKSGDDARVEFIKLRAGFDILTVQVNLFTAVGDMLQRIRDVIELDRETNLNYEPRLRHVKSGNITRGERDALKVIRTSREMAQNELVRFGVIPGVAAVQPHR